MVPWATEIVIGSRTDTSAAPNAGVAETAATGGRSLVVVVLGELLELEAALEDAEDESSGAGVASTVDVTVVSANEPEPQPTSTTSTPRSARTATSRTRIRANIIDQPPSSPLADGWDRKLCSQHRPKKTAAERRQARDRSG